MTKLENLAFKAGYGFRTFGGKMVPVESSVLELLDRKINIIKLFSSLLPTHPPSAKVSCAIPNAFRRFLRQWPGKGTVWRALRTFRIFSAFLRFFGLFSCSSEETSARLQCPEKWKMCAAILAYQLGRPAVNFKLERFAFHPPTEGAGRRKWSNGLIEQKTSKKLPQQLFNF